MKKFFIVLILAIIGCGIIILSSLSDSLHCSYETDTCSLITRIKFVNYTMSEFNFKPADIKNAYCSTAYQPNARGKKSYYVLKLQLDDGNEYSIGSYKKKGLCKVYSGRVLDFVKGKTSYIEYDPAFGFLNLMGTIFGILMFVICVVIITSKPVPDYEGLDDDDDTETKM